MQEHCSGPEQNDIQVTHNLLQAIGQAESRQDFHRRLMVIATGEGYIDFLLLEEIKKVMDTGLELDPEPLIGFQAIGSGKIKGRLKK